MMHGPCGAANPKSPCMNNGMCTKHYPQQFHPETTLNKDGYPSYRRLNNGRTYTKKGFALDNRWVVPYNPYLSKKWNAHINVEICNSILACKYMYKYLYKGADMTSVKLSVPESQQHVSASPMPSTSQRTSGTVQAPDASPMPSTSHVTSGTIQAPNEVSQFVNSRYIIFVRGP